MTVDAQVGPDGVDGVAAAVEARCRAVRDAFAKAVDAAVAAGGPFEVRLSDVEGAQ